MDILNFHPVVTSAGLLEKKVHREQKAEDCFRLLYIASGEVTLSVADMKNTKLSSGGFCLIPAGVSFGLRTGMARMASVAVGNLTGEAPFDKPIIIPDFSEEEDKILTLVEIVESETKASLALASAVLTEILLAIYEEKNEDALPTRLARKLDAYIAENSNSAIQNTEIAAVFGYHPFYISQMMKKKTGLTLRQYVAGYRFRLAKKLLQNTDFAISDIAERVGFTDASYFTKSFKKEFGMTPKEYRKDKQDGEL